MLGWCSLCLCASSFRKQYPLCSSILMIYCLIKMYFLRLTTAKASIIVGVKEKDIARVIFKQLQYWVQFRKNSFWKPLTPLQPVEMIHRTDSSSSAVSPMWSQAPPRRHLSSQTTMFCIRANCNWTLKSWCCDRRHTKETRLLSAASFIHFRVTSMQCITNCHKRD